MLTDFYNICHRVYWDNMQHKSYWFAHLMCNKVKRCNNLAGSWQHALILFYCTCNHNFNSGYSRPCVLQELPIRDVFNDSHLIIQLMTRQVQRELWMVISRRWLIFPQISRKFPAILDFQKIYSTSWKYRFFETVALSCLSRRRRWSHDILQSASSFSRLPARSSQSIFTQPTHQLHIIATYLKHNLCSLFV